MTTPEECARKIIDTDWDNTQYFDEAYDNLEREIAAEIVEAEKRGIEKAIQHIETKIKVLATMPTSDDEDEDTYRGALCWQFTRLARELKELVNV